MDMDDAIVAAFTGDPSINIKMTTAHPEQDHVALVLVTLEAELDQEGWDLPPSLWAIASYESGLTMQTMGMPSAFYQNPPAVLKQLVTVAEFDGRFKERLGAEVSNNFFGLVFFSEGWGVKDLPDEDFLRDWKGRLDEHPDRVEQRMGYALTLDGRIVSIHRDRGEEPCLHEVLNIDGEPVAEKGSLVPTLVRLLKICKDAAPSFVETKVPYREDLP